MSEIKLSSIDDKEMIKLEEKEKMLNEENEKDTEFHVTEENLKASEEIEQVRTDVEIIKTGEVEKMKKQLEESQKELGIGKRIPIGGIKIPGFLKNRCKTKEADGSAAEPDIEPPCVAQNVRKDESKDSQGESQRQLIAKRFKKIITRMPLPTRSGEASTGNNAENHEQGTKEGNPKKQNLIDSIKIPLISVLPRKFTKEPKEQQLKDMELGTAGLASMETLEDSKESNGLVDDGMETVKLDVDDGKDVESSELSGKRKQALFGTWNLRDWRNWPEKMRSLSKHEKAIIAAIILFLILLLLIIILVTGSKPPTSPPLKDGRYMVTSSSCGPLEGLFEDEIFKFRGIPYAVPPVGNKRWMYSEPLDQLDKCWNDTLKAHNSSSTCWQIYMEPNGKWRIDGAEDCLTLDILTPFVRYDTPLPVVVLIDTPTLVGGSPGVLKPTPKIVKTKEVVFVRPNFRLGIFGFFAASALSNSTYPPTSGNYGLSDIITALKWIKSNIVHFGGDPNMITLVGHRAGATLVSALATSHSAKNLFQRAWASSGSVIFPQRVLQLSEQANQPYINQLCSKKPDNLQCLRTYDAEELVEALDDSWRPVISDLPTSKEVNSSKHEWLVLDGTILKEGLWQSDNQHVPLVLGTTAHSEASPQLWEKLQKIAGPKEEAIAEHVKNSYIGTSGLTEEVLNLYNTTWEDLTAMISDIRTICPLLNFTRAQTEQNLSFYVAKLERNHTDFGQIADIDADMSSILGTYEPRTASQRNFVAVIQELFYNYVTRGEWNSKKKDGVLIIGETAEWEDEYPNCDFWGSKNMVPTFARRD
ncbi:hypothetical protein RUM44_004941 [Polyplax serrata]|uniref:Carboxylesterase type B domain-containing protein n=1 Tax=Polyplax serrata TaxID=468196 RepID=A0ABR1AWJ3_POLSC